MIANPKKKQRKKRIVFSILGIVIAALLTIFGANAIVEAKTQEYIYTDIQTIPSQKAGLLLGTAKYNSGGGINPFFKYRIDAAVALYKAGKIKNIVVSGDNSQSSYNEPKDMKKELMKNGVPEDVIYLDYAGFRTLDSVVRMDKIFGQKEFIIISQQFHNQRAIYLARHYGLKAFGYNAKDVKTKRAIKVQIREKFARVKVFVDIITGKSPKFLGEEIHIL